MRNLRKNKKKGRMDGPHAMDKSLVGSDKQRAATTGKGNSGRGLQQAGSLNTPGPRAPAHHARSGQQTVQMVSGSLQKGDVRLVRGCGGRMIQEDGLRESAAGQTPTMVNAHRCSCRRNSRRLPQISRRGTIYGRPGFSGPALDLLTCQRFENYHRQRRQIQRQGYRLTMALDVLGYNAATIAKIGAGINFRG